MMEAPSVFIVEDHPLVRRGIEAVIAREYRLVGSADEASTAVEMIRERRPDLVLLDVKIPGGGGSAVVEAVRRFDEEIRFLALSVSTSREDVVRMFQSGIDGYLVKTADEAFVIDAIARTLAGERPVSPEVAGYLLDIDRDIADADGLERLTPREREVTTLIARGYSYREVAGRLSMSVKTLENHMHHIFTKLGLASRHQLTRMAYETGFLRPDGVGPDEPGADGSQ